MRIHGVLLLVVTGCVSGASFSIGPDGISSSPINLATVFKTLRGVWNELTSHGGSVRAAGLDDPRGGTGGPPPDYDAELESLKSRIEAASSAAVSETKTSQKLTRKRGEKIYGEKDGVELPLTRALFAKKKIKVSKWPIVYGILNAGLIIAIIILAAPYFKEGETIVDEYSKKKKQQEEEQEEALYALYTTDSNVYGDEMRYVSGPVDPPPPVYPQSGPMYNKAAEKGDGGHYAESKFFRNKGNGKKGGQGERQAFSPDVNPKVKQPLQHQQPPPQRYQPYQDEQYRPPHQQYQDQYQPNQPPYRQYGDGGKLTSHTMVFHERDPHVRYDKTEVPPQVFSYSTLDSDSPLYARSGEVPLNELNYYNPTIFTSLEPSSYGCLEKMVCQNPARKGRTLQEIKAASGEKMAGAAGWQSVVDRIDQAAQVGEESGDCAMYYCPPLLPNSGIFEQGDSYSPPPSGNVDAHSGFHSFEYNAGESPVVYESVGPDFLSNEKDSTVEINESPAYENNGQHVMMKPIIPPLTTGRVSTEMSKEYSSTPAGDKNGALHRGQASSVSGSPGHRASIVQLIQAPRIQKPVYHSKASDHSDSIGLRNDSPAPVVIGTSHVVSLNSRQIKLEAPSNPSAEVPNSATNPFKTEIKPGHVVRVEFPQLSAETTTRLFSGEM